MNQLVINEWKIILIKKLTSHEQFTRLNLSQQGAGLWEETSPIVTSQPTRLNSFNTPTIGSTRCTNFLCPLVFLLFYSLQIVNCLLRFGSFWRVFNYRKPCNLYVPKLGSFLFPGYIYMQVRVIPKLIKSYIGELLLYQIIKENIANYISQEINKCCIKCINLGSLIFNLVQLHHSYYIFLQI